MKQISNLQISRKKRYSVISVHPVQGYMRVMNLNTQRRCYLAVFAPFLQSGGVVLRHECRTATEASLYGKRVLHRYVLLKKKAKESDVNLSGHEDKPKSDTSANTE